MAGPSGIFVTRRIPDSGLGLLRREEIDVAVGVEEDQVPLARGDLLAGVKGASVLLSLLTETVDREVLEANPALRGVANYAVGYDNVDVGAATELGIPVSNTPDALTETTADLTWALIVGVARRVVEADRLMRSGRFRLWGPTLLLGGDVGPGGSGRRKVLGVVGFGRIGRAVARRARGFEMDVLAHDPHHPDRVASSPLAEWAGLDELLERSDFVSIHAPLSDETHHLIGASRLGRMKETAYLVNTARGPIVDEEALVRALREGWIAGAGLDVYEDEPDMEPGLAALDNVILLPHVGSASHETRDEMAVMAAGDALHHLRGARAHHVVNPEVYDGEAYGERVAGLEAEAG